MTTIRDHRARRASRLLGVSFLAVLLPLLAACGDREPTGRDTALTPTEFIEIIVALREAEWEADREPHPDSAEVQFFRRRAEILERYDATEEGVRGFIERHHGRPGLMSSVWDSIAHRLRTSRSAEVPDDPSPFEEVEDPYLFEDGR